MRNPLTGKTVANLSLGKSTKHVEVEERHQRSMVRSKAVLQIAMIEADFAKGLTVGFYRWAVVAYL